MIKIDDFLDELCATFPDIERSSIKKICTKGLYGIKNILKRNEEIIIQGAGNKEVKFYIPLLPENQAQLTAINVNKRKNYEEYCEKHLPRRASN